ncbi:MAG: lipoprotein insertase outer membrane protein LolB [Pseudomonadota bacterium]|nr:lipoprotein insertase outer membrane protein LolB [Pseudomonadota bacterium]
MTRRIDAVSRALLRGLGAALVAGLLVGCVSRPPMDGGAAAALEVRTRALVKLDHWQAAGKLGLRRGPERLSGYFDWLETASHYRLALTGPFGSGALMLSGDAESVELRGLEAGPVRAADPESLVETATGWRLPVSALRDWVRGMPVAGAPVASMRVDPGGRIQALEQLGWHIQYAAYGEIQPMGGRNRVWLPGRLVLERDGLLLTLVVTEWQLGRAPQVRTTPVP